MKRLYNILMWLAGIILLLLLTAITLTRFTGGSINTAEKIILGYDEEKGQFQIWEKKTYNFDGIDGPYIIDNKLYEVTEDNELRNRNINRNDTLWVQVNNSDKDRFKFQLKDSIALEPDTYELPGKLIVISDIEGNFDGFSSFLINNGVINKNYDWIFGNGHLLLNGDFIDRGDNVTQVLWLIYKLESQAQRQNGKLHYILGNHEIMNFQGNASYNRNKYKRIAQIISKNDNIKDAVKFVYSDQTEIGKWLRSKNIIEKIGNYIFVHAGLSPDILKYKVSVSDINRIARDNWDKNLYHEEENDKVENFITGKKGVYWYRGLATDYKYYDKITEGELDKILEFYQSDKIIFGHTVIDDIAKDLSGKLINTDVKHGQEKNSEKTKGLFIESGIEYKINGKGVKTKI